MKRNTLLLGIILSLLLVVSLSLIGLIVNDLNDLDSYSDTSFLNNAEQTHNTNSDNQQSFSVDDTVQSSTVDEIKQEDKVDSVYLAKIELLDEPVREVVKTHVSKTKRKLDLSSPVVANEVVKQAQNLSKDTRIIVLLKDVAFKQNVLNSLTSEEFELKIDGSDWFAGMINNNSLGKLQDNVLVNSLTIDRRMKTATAESFPLVNSTLVTNKQILGVTVNGTNQNVCLIDSGINYAHAEIGGNGLYRGTKVIEGYDYCGGNVNPCGGDDGDGGDEFGHGTGMASIIGADSATFKGMAPGVKFVALKVTADNIAFTSNIVKGVEWCVNNVSKFNLSVMYIGLATEGELFAGIEDDPINCGGALGVKLQLAVDANFTIIAPSGNQGHTVGISSSACNKNVLSVGGVEDGPPVTADKFWNNSNRHAILDMLAPAEQIIRLSLIGSGAGIGTSEAAAHVAGAAVLLKDFYQQKYNIILHHNQTERILKKTGINITDPVTGLKFPRLDVWRAINYEEYPPNIILLTANNSVFNQNVQLLYNASDDHNLYNCTLFVNDVANQTNISLPSNTVLNYSLTLGSGNYTWKVQCYDNSTFPNVNTSLVNTIRVDADAPIVSLETPLNNAVSTNTLLTFNYNVTDAYNILNCTLFINSTANETNTTVLKGVTQNFTVNLSNGNYAWNISCYDNVSNLGVSSVNNLAINLPPVWNPVPADQVKELGTALNYDLNADDSDVLIYKVNDTVNFKINAATGLVENNTFLAVGVYNIKVNATDTANSFVEKEFKVTVQDTTLPVFTTGVAPETKEFATQGVAQNIVATDVAGITYSVNDSNFSIDVNGLLTNATQLAVRLYNVKVTATDANNNAANSVGVITVSDTTLPVFTTGVATQTKEFALAGVSQSIVATDAAGVTYAVNDSNFSINGSGLLINATATQLAVGIYNVKVTATDANNNAANSVGVITVSDTTLPVFTTGITTETKEFALQGVVQQLVATDAAGVASYVVNNSNFTINGTGYLVTNTQLAVGAYNLNVTATDVNGNKQSSFGVITVSDTTLPVFTTGVTTQTKEFALAGVSQNLVATDAAGITYSVNDTNFSITVGGLLTNNTQLAVRLYNLKITATDANNNAANSVGVITVSDTTLPTWTTAPSNQNININQSFAVTVTAADSNTPIIYSINDTTNFTINAATGEIRNNTKLIVNTYNLLVTAKDNSNNAVTGTMTVTVGNNPPTITGLIDATKIEDFGLIDNLIDLHAFASDVETAASGLTYTIQSQTNNAVVNCVIDGNRFVDCTTAANMNGTSDVTVRVADPQTAFAEDVFRLTITAVNDVPTVTSASLSPSVANTSTIITCTGSGAADIDGDTLTHRYQFKDTGGVLQTYSATNTFDCGAVASCDKGDTITCEYKVNDGTVDSNIATSTGLVISNAAPTLNVISGQVTNEDTQANFDLSTVTNDIDGDTLTYAIVTENVAQVDCNIAGSTLQMIPAQNYFGAASCDVRTNDGTVNSNTQTVSITVNPVNDTPTLSALADKTYAEDSGLQNNIFDLHTLASDVETAVADLTYTIQAQSNNSMVNCVIDSNRFVDCTTQQDKNGANDVIVRVTDPQNAFAEKTFRVTITVVNDAPTVTGVALSPATADTNTVFTCVGSGKNDLDNDAMTELYEFSDVAGVLQAFSVGNTFNCATIGCDKNDNVKCKYKVNDGSADSNIVSSNIVTVSNTAPTVASAALTPTTANTNTLFTCAGSGNSDVDGDALTNLYQFKDASGVLQAFSASAAFNCGTVADCDLGDAITCEHKVNDGAADSNIVASNTVNIVDMPDLIVEQLKVVLPAAPNTNELTLIRFFIKNIGNLDTNNIGWNLNYQDGTVSQDNLVNIAAGQSHLVNRFVQFTATGMHTITATADPTNAIAELDENNNAQSIQKNVS